MHLKLLSAKMAAILSRGRWVNVVKDNLMCGSHVSVSIHIFHQPERTYEELSWYINGLVQDCSDSSALAMELQSCTKPASRWLNVIL